MKEKAIITKNLSKKFGKFTAVDQVSLHVEQGEIYGFLGLNGAGKTTTIRMLLGLIKPTNGDIEILGEHIKHGHQGPWHKVGSLVEVPYAYPELTVKENLDIFKKLHNLKDSSAVSNIIEKLKLGEYTNRKAGHLSLGNAQRLGLAKALIHNPQILILDEPSNGLDPAGIVEIRELLLDLAKNQGITIFISSHILAEISKIADRIGIIHNGQLLQEVNANELENLVKKSLLVKTRDNDSAQKILLEKNLKVAQNPKNELELTTDYALYKPEEIATLLVNGGVPPVSLYTFEEDLEDYFLRFINENGGEQ